MLIVKSPAPRIDALCPRRAEGGSTLIEVLVAVVVLAVGLLGLAGLQMTSLQSNRSAYLRSQASILASDLADRMRARRQASIDDIAKQYVYDDDSDDDDRKDWNDRVTDLLGAGASGSLARNGAVVTITITWDDARGCIKDASHACGDDDPGLDQKFEYRTQI